MAKKDETKVETAPDGTVLVPVTAEDPEVTAQTSAEAGATPTEIEGKKVKDSDPLPEVDTSAYPERPYSEAITDEHRAFLERAGVRID